MKNTIKKVKIFCSTIAVLFLVNQKSFAQNWLLAGNPDAGVNGLLSLPGNNFLGGTQTSNVLLGTGGNTYMFIGGSIIPAYNGLVAIGNGFLTPLYQLDVSGTAPNGDVDVLNLTSGYRIGGAGGLDLPSYVLWHNGNRSNIFVGSLAGNALPGYGNCAFVGNWAGNSNTANSNTAVGADALDFNVTGAFNTAIGCGAMLRSNTGGSNTAVGNAALANGPNTGSNNVAIGEGALVFNTGGGSNTSVGQASMWFNQGGTGNAALGFNALYTNVAGNANVAVGAGALFTATADNNTATGSSAAYRETTGTYNTADGYEALYGAIGMAGNNNATVGAFSLSALTTGHDNAALGFNAGLSAGQDFDNIFIGSGADRGPVVVSNAGAIGPNTVTSLPNQMEIGNNTETVTLGLSTFPYTAPQTNLEIATRNSPWGGLPTAPNGCSLTSTGFSGVRLDDLTTASVPCPNPGSGVLSVNSAGDIIYVSGIPSPATIGTCAVPTILPALGGAFNLAPSLDNFYFLGNGTGFTQVTDVLIGEPPCVNGQAKLDVLQASGNMLGSTGISVLNTDGNTCPIVGGPIIGLKSIVNSATPYAQYEIAGYFQSVPHPNCAGILASYSVFVPHYGGTASYGWNYGFGPVPQPGRVLQINGPLLRAGAFWVWSDMKVKKDTSTYSGGLAIVRKLHPVYYEYNGKAGIDTSAGQQIGLIAEQVQNVAPFAVDTLYAKLDSTDANASSLLEINTDALFYTSLNAIKQLDSTVTAKTITIDSLRATLDSLRSAFQSYSSCLLRLCGHAPIHHDGGNSGDSNTTTNTLEVTLTALSDAPLLYQNIPNPFQNGTKINYYLPEGTMGASIVFYDSYGNQMKTVQLSQTGNGTLNVTPDNLTAGIYSYSLVVNNTVIDTKRMILQK